MLFAEASGEGVRVAIGSVAEVIVGFQVMVTGRGCGFIVKETETEAAE